MISWNRRFRKYVPDPVAGKYPYLLRGLSVERPDQVWCAIKHLTRLVILLACGGLTGCSRSMIVTLDPQTGTVRRQIVRSDWDMFVHHIEWQLRRELQNYPPDAGRKTWEDYWRWTVEGQRKYASDSQGRIEYIRQRRAELGLPAYEDCFEDEAKKENGNSH